MAKLKRVKVIIRDEEFNLTPRQLINKLSKLDHWDYEDFFENNRGEIVIDNPPFSKKKEVCIRLKELDKPFMLILPSNIIVLKWFQSLFKNQIQIIIPNKRIGFTHLKSDKSGYTPPLGSFIYCYKMNLNKDLIFL